MKRTVLSPEKKLRPQRREQLQQTDTPPTRSTADPKGARPAVVVASLATDRSRANQSYSSLALSPKGRYALVAGKDTIQLVSVGPDGLKRVRSLKISHHFYNPGASAPSPDAAGGTGKAQQQQQQQYGDLSGIFHLAAETRASAVTAGVANMNLNQQFGNITVTKVAWSNNYSAAGILPALKHSTRNLSQRGSNAGATGSAADAGTDESAALSLSTRATDANDRGNTQKGRRRRSSRQQRKSASVEDADGDGLEGEDEETMKEDESLVAVAGSNGVVAVWRAKRLLFSDFGKPSEASKGGKGGGFGIGGSKKTRTSSPSSASILAKQQRTQQPEAILNQHTRAVNGMAWHPTRSGLLLTASQDGSIILWKRTALANPSRTEDQQHEASKQQQQHPKEQPSWFSIVGGVVGGSSGQGGKGSRAGEEDEENSQKYTWRCKTTFSLGEQEAVRDIQWSRLLPDVFGVVTSNGNLVVYNMHVAIKALVKIAAHTGDAASLDWHPRWPFVVATGGSGDRFVKVWDLESSLDPIVSSQNDRHSKRNNPRKEVLHHHQENSNTHGSTKSSSSSTYSASSGESLHSSAGGASLSSYGPPNKWDLTSRSTASAWSMGGRHHKSTSSGFSKYVLSISASVTQVRWRPPSNDFGPNDKNSDDPNQNETMVDRHDSMLAVATARLTSAGGSGTLSLWSFHRPFMSLSIVEGHEESAVSDFVWVRTPQTVPHRKHASEQQEHDRMGFKHLASESSLSALTSSQRLRKKSWDFSDLDYRGDEQATEVKSVSYIWQNVLSVGRDGQCIMQSFARGERRIRHVPSSCFAMANLSPFQEGYGSLQCFSVYQDVPNRAEDDFMLTGLRQDEHTAKAPGVFFEEDLQKHLVNKKKEVEGVGKRLPVLVPKLRFSVLDQGSLDANGMPIENEEETLCIAPEVLHLSRFARLYKMYPDNQCQTRVELCLYNSTIAEQLKCRPLARMWKTVATLLDASGLDELPAHDSASPANAFQFVIFPTVKSLLFERAEAGDVQTNVALCEVLQVVDPGGEKTRIPGLGIRLVREWYLSYIDLLHQMCLFSEAAFLIKHSKDPAIGALSQQSTTFHESCPRCGKPLDSTADTSGANGVSNAGSSGSSRQVCKNCRRRVGICFICHEPVNGVFVWCPGCGHGGHLEHALQWFGGLDGRAVRTVCPTGCGHKCNFVQFASTFPRTMSMALSDSSPIDHTTLAIPGHQARCMPATTSSLYNLDKTF